MKYNLSYSQPHRHILDIELIIENNKDSELTLQLPAWRPGRYELQNYSRNILRVNAFDPKGNTLDIHKTSRERWTVKAGGASTLYIKYQYYCYQMDAGGSWLDEDQLYLNFINCLLYIPGKENEACQVYLEIPEDYKVACGIPFKNKNLSSESFYQLVDSPMIASKDLLHAELNVQSIPFHIWIQGNAEPNWEKIKSDFEKFIVENLKVFKELPEKDYHFIYHLLPYKHYHGVEHRNSTVVTLGPANALHTPAMYEDFLGISCHELFHAWNVIKIRPKEMLPYDFTKENYFRTGYVIEGITTYYGDLLLARCGVFTIEQYFKELNQNFQRHFENFGNDGLSLADSSFDLWVDGYTAGIPNRKVSIYVKGCIAALILDLTIRINTNHSKNLDDLMKILWDEFGKKGKGYSEEEFISAAQKVSGQSLEDYFNECIYGTGNLEKKLSDCLQAVGCELSIKPGRSITESRFGFRFCLKEERSFVEMIQPGSPADKVLSKDDEILSVNGINLNNNLEYFLKDKQEATLTIRRWGKVIERKLESDGKVYLQNYLIRKKDSASESEKINFEKWLGQNF